MPGHNGRRKTDIIPRGKKQQISRLAFLLAGLLIALSAASLLFVGWVATQASDKLSIQSQRYLFENTLRDRTHVIIREQLTLARWDETVRKIVRNFDHEFVRRELKSMWTDFGHDRSLIVDGNNRVIAESFEDYTHIVNRPLEETSEFLPLSLKARSLFEALRTRVTGGYSFSSIQNLEPDQIAASGFIMLDGKPALASAMAIIPDMEQVALPTKEATLLISVRFLDAAFIAFLNAQIRFEDLVFRPGPGPDPKGPNYPVHDVTGLLLGHFAWEKLPVAAPIWNTVVPVIIGLSCALGAMAFAVAWKIGHLTSSLQASESQNRYLALHDPLSGLANRLHFNRGLTELVNNLAFEPFALMHCDLDRFKYVNDTYGHAAGDAVIKEVARRLKEVIGENGLPCRVGGDEFLILIRSTVDRVRLQKIAIQLLKVVPMPIDIGAGQTAEVGMSIGIAIAPDHGHEQEGLQAAADAALYIAKNEGRGRLSFASIEPDPQNAPPPAAYTPATSSKNPAMRPAAETKAGKTAADHELLATLAKAKEPSV